MKKKLYGCCTTKCIVATIFVGEVLEYENANDDTSIA